MSIQIQSLRDIDWHTWEPRDCATLLFVIQEGSVLLIRKKRGLGAGKINAPGGRLDPGESFPQCAIREVQEELLITPDSLRKEESYVSSLLMATQFMCMYLNPLAIVASRPRLMKLNPTGLPWGHSVR